MGTALLSCSSFYFTLETVRSVNERLLPQRPPPPSPQFTILWIAHRVSKRIREQHEHEELMLKVLVRKVFRRIDTDKSGTLDKKEMRLLLAEVGQHSAMDDEDFRAPRPCPRPPDR